MSDLNDMSPSSTTYGGVILNEFEKQLPLSSCRETHSTPFTRLSWLVLAAAAAHSSMVAALRAPRRVCSRARRPHDTAYPEHSLKLHGDSCLQRRCCQGFLDAPLQRWQESGHPCFRPRIGCWKRSLPRPVRTAIIVPLNTFRRRPKEAPPMPWLASTTRRWSKLTLSYAFSRSRCATYVGNPSPMRKPITSNSTSACYWQLRFLRKPVCRSCSIPAVSTSACSRLLITVASSLCRTDVTVMPR